MRLVVQRVAHGDQRYPTLGDWQFASHPSPTLTISVSILHRFESEVAVAIHETVEALLCARDGITTQMVDDFDMGLGADMDEPGDSVLSPYHRQHVIATFAERMACRLMGLDWNEHVDQCNSPVAKVHPNEAGPIFDMDVSL